MASPQKENGYIPIATEIIQSMQKTHWSNSEIRIIFCIFEKTYGWHKKEDWISLSQFSKMTGLLPQHISRNIKKLIKRNIIIRNKNKISFNKNYEQWDKLLPKMVLPKMSVGVTKNVIQLLPKLVTTKDSTKDTIQKKDDFSFLTDDKKNHTEEEWKKILRNYKKKGYQTRGDCKLIVREDGKRYLLDRFGKWKKYSLSDYINNKK